MTQRLPASPHASAFKAVKRHPLQYILMTLEQLLVRIISTTPLIYALITKQFFGVGQEHVPALALLCCIPLWILFVLPFRYRLGGQISAWFGHESSATNLGNYGYWLTRGTLRLFKILPLLLPLFAYLIGFYYLMSMVAFNVFTGYIESLGKLVGGNILVGVVILIVLFLFVIVMAFKGWRRIMPFFYLKEASVHTEHKIRRRNKQNRLEKATFINFLIVFPPLAISFFILSLSLSPRLTGSTMFDSVIIFSALTQFDFPVSGMLQAGGILAILYLPFVLYRKAALCAVIHHAGNRHDAA